MITPVLMPQLGLEVNEGTVTAVLVKIGAEVRRDQPLIELETDKALTEVVAPCDGIVRTIEAEPGQTVPVGAIMIKLADSASEPVDGDPAPRGSRCDAAGRERLRVAPVARRAAAERGIDLATITGTGPRGRITLYDIKAVAANGDAGAGAGRGDAPVAPTAAPLQHARAGRTELTPTRRAIARRMTASQSIPQYHLVREVDATHLIAEKAAHASRGTPPSISGARSRALRRSGSTTCSCRRSPRRPCATPHWRPRMSKRARPSPRISRSREEIDVGLAVATDRGLVVPVIAERAHAGPGRDRFRAAAPGGAGKDRSDRARGDVGSGDHALEPRRRRGRPLHRDGQSGGERDRRRRADGRAARSPRQDDRRRPDR